ncbi:MAG TPA: phage tail tip lysozyme [Polyangia bacterium]
MLSTLAGCGGGDITTDDGLSEAALSSPERTAFNFFVSKGLTKNQAAGVIGNLMQESGVNAGAVQYGGGPGRGIAQWSVGGRWDADRGDNVAWYAGSKGTSRWALSTQLNFTWYELANFGGYGLSELRGSSTLTSATIQFQDRFEGCGQCDQSQRIHYAEQALSAYGGSTGGGADCYSGTLGRQEPDNACVQSKYDRAWYQCANGSWVDRWTDPAACTSVHPL